jgi:hypothetical protein
MRAEGIVVHQAAADADVSIVNTAINQAHAGCRVAIVGNDTDLLVLLVALAEPTNNINLYKPLQSPRSSTAQNCFKKR